jgi:protein O-GlcNAc transferase
MPNLNEALTIAFQKHKAGNWAEAEQIYRQIISIEPLHADALHLLGVINHQAGKHDLAIEHIGKALAVNASVAEFHNNIGEAYRALRNFDQAELHYRQALSLRSNYAEPHSNIGVAHMRQGRLEEAISCFRRALSIKPQYTEALTNLGIVLRVQGQLEEAISCFRRALAIKPDYWEALLNLGIALRAEGKFEEAITYFHQAIALQPTAEAYNWLGTCFTGLSDVEEAAVYYRQAIELSPSFFLAYKNLAASLRNQGKLEESVGTYRHALSLLPTDGLKILIGTSLPIIPESKEHVMQSRRNYQAEVSRLVEQSLRLDDPHVEVGSTNFYLAYQGFGDRDLQCSLSQVYEKACPSLNYVAPHCRPLHPTPSRGKIKIGFVSKFLYDHTIGKLMRGIMAELSRSTFSVTVLMFPQNPDPVSEFIVRQADRNVILPLTLDAARQVIAQEELDILFYPEIGMDPLTYYLAFSRLAPVQCVTWGHPDTTGIRTIDYFISSDLLEPNDAESQYSERLVRLAHLPTYYYKPDMASGLKSRKDFGLEDERVTYLCPQSLFKFHPDFDELIARVLRAHPEGQVVIIEGQWKHFIELILRRFRKTIPDVMDRIRILPRQSSQDFLRLISLSDVILDPIKWSGGSTTYEAMSFGIPIVTMPSEFMRGRVTYACYKQMGIMDCVASTPAEYVQLAVRLGTNSAYRAEIKAKLLNANSVLYENADVVRELEQFFTEACGRTQDPCSRTD